jgi:hypothetical protein
MRFRSGLIAGFLVGYYYGSKAGRERYVQIERYLTNVRSSEQYQHLVTCLGELAEASVQRSRTLVEQAGDRVTHVATAPPGYDYLGDPTLN